MGLKKLSLYISPFIFAYYEFIYQYSYGIYQKSNYIEAVHAILFIIPLWEHCIIVTNTNTLPVLKVIIIIINSCKQNNVAKTTTWTYA